MSNFKTFREQARLTQVDAARLLEEKRSTVAMWDAGEALPHAGKLLKIARIYGCTVDALLGEKKEQNRCPPA